MRTLWSCAVTAVCLASVACSGSSGGNPTTPTPPTPPAPTVAGITVTGLDAIRSGFFSTFTATASMSDGSSQSITPAWSSDNSQVASVDASGNVNGNANGTATIIASYQGRTGTKVVRIVTNYDGNWSGLYRVTKCDQSGAFAGWCASFGPTGSFPITLALTQGGNGRDQISGTLALGSLSGNVTGSVTGDGRLNLGGTYVVQASSFLYSVTIGGWNTQASSTIGMAGSWAQSLAAINIPGNAYMENSILTMTHQTPQATVVAAPGSYAFPSIEEHIRRLVH